MSNAIEITDSTFENEVIKSDIPVLVDFWAPWCGPCKMIGPVLDEISAELDGKLKIAKINIDNEQNTAAQFQVMSIPTLILFKNGAEAEKMVGALPKDAILDKIKPHI